MTVHAEVKREQIARTSLSRPRPKRLRRPESQIDRHIQFATEHLAFATLALPLRLSAERQSCSALARFANELIAPHSLASDAIGVGFVPDLLGYIDHTSCAVLIVRIYCSYSHQSPHAYDVRLPGARDPSTGATPLQHLKPSRKSRRDFCSQLANWAPAFGLETIPTLSLMV